MRERKRKVSSAPELKKAPTGVRGLDEITYGGLPQGRPTIVCGGPGCGKTMLAVEFLVRGAIDYDEPGVFMAFEETPEDLAKNVASLGFDLNGLVSRKKPNDQREFLSMGRDTTEPCSARWAVVSARFRLTPHSKSARLLLRCREREIDHGRGPSSPGTRSPRPSSRHRPSRVSRRRSG